MKATNIAELDLMRNVLIDICDLDPGLRVQAELFFDKVENICRTRGWHSLLLVDLPKLGNLIDMGLSSGFFNFKDLPVSFGVLNNEFKVRSSWIYNSVISLLFNLDGSLYVDIDANTVLGIRQVLYMYKKLRIDCPKERTVNAVYDFVSIDQELHSPSGSWNKDQYLLNRSSFASSVPLGVQSSTRRALGNLDDICRRVIPSREVNIYDIKPKHGPGAVADLRSGNDKYTFPHWPTKLDNVFPLETFGYLNETFIDSEMKSSSPKEPPARLIAVPKTYKGPRLIASEPTAHQFLQQGLMRWIRKNLSSPLRTSICFDSQDPSKDRALEASIDGRLATVDLSSASDRLSCWVVERVFDSNQSLLQALHAVRTRSIIDATGTDCDLSLQMKKFAAQGSAVTFPVQTIVYACCCYSAIITQRGIKPTLANIKRVSREVRVFGDDIILPSSAVPILVDLLHSMQLKVNVTKSHYLGLFRESCGMDAYKGSDVTPVYASTLRLEPGGESLVSWVEISNNFHHKGYWKTASWMMNQIPRKLRRLLIITNDSSPGIRLATFCEGARVNGSRTRFSSTLHRNEARALCLKHKTQKRSRGSSDDLYDFFIQDPNPETNWKHGYVRGNSVQLCTEWVPVT